MATIPVFRTWTAGEIVTAAFLNVNIRDNGNFFASWPVFEGRQTVAQSIPNSTNTAVLLDTEDIDTDNGHSTVTNTDRYTGQTAGRFQVSGGTGWAGSAAGRRGAYPALNGTPLNARLALIPAGVAGSISVPAKTFTTFLNGSTDYVSILAFQDSGGALNTDATNFQCNMTVRMLGTV